MYGFTHLMSFLCAEAVCVRALEVALFPSSGCYSHDVMMREVGEQLADSNVTWFQIYMYEFGFGMIPIPDAWSRLIFYRHDSEGAELMRVGSVLMYETNIPMDLHRPWDVRGIFAFLTILQRNQRFCGEMLRSAEFRNVLSSKRFDLIVIDHFIQECFTAMASLLNTTTVQFSNWPIADGYVTSLNVPANPSSTAKTGTPFSSLHMTFLERIMNTVFHLLIIVARSIQIFTIRNFYAKHGYFGVDMNRIEAGHLFYAGRSELLFDAIRPINNRIKHFGCPSCGAREDYNIEIPPNFKSVETKTVTNLSQDCSTNSCRAEKMDRKDHREAHKSGNDSCARTLLRERQFIRLEAKQTAVSAQKAENESEKMQRFRQVQRNFPQINFGSLENKKFALVSFGSVAKIRSMPPILLDIFLRTLGGLNYSVIWQTNSETADFLMGHEVPPNVILVPWVPLKILLAHRNLLYFVCHGGINTVNEVLMFGVPIIGIPLQGDQPSNLQRLVDLGMGIVSKMSDLWRGGLAEAISHMEMNIERYSKRALKVSQMAADHRRFAAGTQQFWLRWAMRHGTKLKANGRKYFSFAYQTSFEYFAASQLIVFFVPLFSLFYLLRH